MSNGGNIEGKVVVITYGRVDVMINNAGLMPQSPLERLRIDEWDRTRNC